MIRETIIGFESKKDMEDTLLSMEHSVKYRKYRWSGGLRPYGFIPKEATALLLFEEPFDNTFISGEIVYSTDIKDRKEDEESIHFKDFIKQINKGIKEKQERQEKLIGKTVTELIFNGKKMVIPMSDVSHIEKTYINEKEVKYEYYKDCKIGDLKCIEVVTKHTTWNSEQDQYNNPILLNNTEAEDFLKAWCTYRYELEKDTIKDLTK